MTIQEQFEAYERLVLAGVAEPLREEPAMRIEWGPDVIQMWRPDFQVRVHADDHDPKS